MSSEFCNHCRTTSWSRGICVILAIMPWAAACSLPSREADSPALNDRSTAANATSHDPGGRPPWVSVDGNRVVFTSQASNLVKDDTNICDSPWGMYDGIGQCPDIFMFDQKKGMRRVSVDTDGSERTGPSYMPAVSADGLSIIHMVLGVDVAGTDGRCKIAESCAGIVISDQGSSVARVLVEFFEPGEGGWEQYLGIDNAATWVVFLSIDPAIVRGEEHHDGGVYVYDIDTNEVAFLTESVVQAVDDSYELPIGCDDPAVINNDEWEVHRCKWDGLLVVVNKRQKVARIVSPSDDIVSDDGDIVVWNEDDDIIRIVDMKASRDILRRESAAEARLSSDGKTVVFINKDGSCADGSGACSDVRLVRMEAQPAAEVVVMSGATMSSLMSPGISSDGHYVAFLGDTRPARQNLGDAMLEVLVWSLEKQIAHVVSAGTITDR